MLAADKLQLQSSLKQQATALKEKEFNLHHSNLMTVGTQAAVLAGLDITMFVEFNPPPNSEFNPQFIGRALKFLYYMTITSAFCANILVVASTTILSVLGAGLALRGPDGSMMTATDGLYEERTSIFGAFGVGLACTLGSTLLCVLIILHWEAALVCMCITIYTCWKVYTNYQRICKRFGFDESKTVDFRDIFDGPANIYTYARRHKSNKSKKHDDHHQQQHRHHRDRSGGGRQHNSSKAQDCNNIQQQESQSENSEMDAFIPSNYSSGSRARVSHRGRVNSSKHQGSPNYSYGSDSSGDYEMPIQTV